MSQTKPTRSERRLAETNAQIIDFTERMFALELTGDRSLKAAEKLNMRALKVANMIKRHNEHLEQHFNGEQGVTITLIDPADAVKKFADYFVAIDLNFRGSDDQTTEVFVKLTQDGITFEAPTHFTGDVDSARIEFEKRGAKLKDIKADNDDGTKIVVAEIANEDVSSISGCLKAVSASVALPQYLRN